MKRIILIIILVLLTTALISKCIASDVLGRPRYVLGDNFEDLNWKYDRAHSLDSRHYSSNGFWWGPDGEKGSDPSNRGDPAIIERVPTPKNGKSKSTGALEIGTNIPDNDNWPTQDDLCTIGYEDILKCKLMKADQPVFVVRILLPLFDTWEEYYSFGFRQSTRSNDTSKSYYPSIWLEYNPFIHTIAGDYALSGPYFVLRIFYFDGSDLNYHEESIGPIKQSGWWTLAIAFDENGACSYYARPGTDIFALTEENKIFDDTQFMKKYGKKALLMHHVHSGLFSMGYLPEKSNTNLRFVIDDYEVWVVK